MIRPFFIGDIKGQGQGSSGHDSFFFLADIKGQGQGSSGHDSLYL